MKKQIIQWSIALFLSALLFQSCLHDVRPRILKREGITAANTIKGKQILDQVWKKQGGDKLAQHQVYSFRGFDTWQGPLAKIGRFWPDLATTLDFRFQVDTLDGQLTFVDGERQGTIIGLHNANYYEIKNGETEFLDRYAKSNVRAAFGLFGVQYFSELLGRLRQAPIISYAGKQAFNDKQYDLVFCTWGKPEPHIGNDQYLLWINQETGLLDYVEYSVREPHVKPPGYKMIGGALEYADYREIDGVLIPHDQIVYSIKKKANQNKFLHRWTISDFQFDSFHVERLKPIEQSTQ